MRRTILIIVAVLLLLAALGSVGFLFYRNRQANESNTTANPFSSNNSAQLPETSNDVSNATNNDVVDDGGSDNEDEGPVVKKIIDADILSPTMNRNQSVLMFFNKATSQFFTADLDGANQQVLTETKFVNAKTVTISPSKTSAILSFENPNSKVSLKYFYEFGKDLAIKLSENFDAFAFSPDGEKVFYKYTDVLRSINTFNISNANGTDWKPIKDFSVTNVLLDWVPNSDKLAFRLTPSSFRQSAYYVFDQNGENVISILNKGYGVDGVWSSDGKRLLATYALERTTNLGLVAVNIDGSERISIPNSRTFVQKCVWMADSISILCATPKSIDPRYLLPDDYNNGNFTTDDNFFRYNTKTGERIQFNLELEEGATLPKIDAVNLFLSSDELTLYFQNKADGNSLYRIRLDQAL